MHNATMAKVVNFPLSMSPQFTWFLKASQEHLRVVWKANDADCIPEYRLSEAREGSGGSFGALPCAVFPWGTRQGYCYALAPPPSVLAPLFS